MPRKAQCREHYVHLGRPCSWRLPVPKWRSSASTCWAGRGAHGAWGPELAGAGWGRESRTRTQRPRAPGAGGGCRGERGLQCPQPDGLAQGGSGPPLPAPRLCMGDPYSSASASAEADPGLRNLKSSPSGLSRSPRDFVTYWLPARGISGMLHPFG